jgi:hypothetical protein
VAKALATPPIGTHSIAHARDERITNPVCGVTFAKKGGNIVDYGRVRVGGKLFPEIADHRTKQDPIPAVVGFRREPV